MGNVAFVLERKLKEKGKVLKKIAGMDKLRERLLKGVEKTDKDIEVLQKAIDLTVRKTKRVPQKAKTQTVVKGVTKTKEPSGEITPQDAIVKLLTDRKAKLSASEILKGITDRGWKTKSDKPASVIYTSLSRLVSKKAVRRGKRGKIVVFYTE